MGAITPDKKLYDQKTVEVFEKAGWKAFAMTRAGRYADVVGVKGSSLALIEVKSPNETSTASTYDDAANLSSELDRKIGRYLREARPKVCGFFSGKSIQKLYAVSVACQLYRYMHEFEELAPDYEKIGNGIARLSNIRFSKTPYLVVPVEHANEAQEAMSILKSHGYITSYKAWQSSPICIIETSLR